MKTKLAVFAVILAVAGALAFNFVLKPRNIKKAEEVNRVYLAALRRVVTRLSFDKGALKDIAEAVADPEVSGVSGLWLSPGMPHRRTKSVSNYPTLAGQDTGNFGYVNDPKDPKFGTVFIDCTHADSSGKGWNSY